MLDLMIQNWGPWSVLLLGFFLGMSVGGDSPTTKNKKQSTADRLKEDEELRRKLRGHK